MAIAKRKNLSLHSEARMMKKTRKKRRKKVRKNKKKSKSKKNQSFLCAILRKKVIKTNYKNQKATQKQLKQLNRPKNKRSETHRRLHLPALMRVILSQMILSTSSKCLAKADQLPQERLKRERLLLRNRQRRKRHFLMHSLQVSAPIKIRSLTSNHSEANPICTKETLQALQ